MRLTVHPLPTHLVCAIAAVVLAGSLWSELTSHGVGCGHALFFALAPDLDPVWFIGALAWAVHIATDRALGFGPRNRAGFQRG